MTMARCHVSQPLLLLLVTLITLAVAHQEKPLSVTTRGSDVIATNSTSQGPGDENNALRFCPIGKFRFYSELEEEMFQHVNKYHGINRTDYEGTVGGSKKCMAKIIYRRKTSVWHARLLQLMLKHEIFPGEKLHFGDPDFDLNHLTPGTSISDLYRYESCKYVFLILHPQDLQDAHAFLVKREGNSYYYPESPVKSVEREKSWIEKEIEAGFFASGHIFIPVVADRVLPDDYYEKATALPGVLKNVAADNQALSFETSNEMLSCKMSDFMTGRSKECTGSCSAERLRLPLDPVDADRMGLPHHPHPD